MTIETVAYADDISADREWLLSIGFMERSPGDYWLGIMLIYEYLGSLIVSVSYGSSCIIVIDSLHNPSREDVLRLMAAMKIEATR